MNEQQPRTTAPTGERTNDTYVSREEYLISHIYQPTDLKIFYRKDVQADGGVKCKVCVEIAGATWCVYVDCDDIIIKKAKAG